MKRDLLTITCMGIAVIIYLLTGSCKKDSKNSNAGPDINKVSGMRTWKRVHIDYGPGYDLTDSSMVDTAFALTITSDTSLYEFGKAIYFTSAQQNTGSTDYYYTSAEAFYNGVTLTYTYPSGNLSLTVDSSYGAMQARNYIVYTSP